VPNPILDLSAIVTNASALGASASFISADVTMMPLAKRLMGAVGSDVAGNLFVDMRIPAGAASGLYQTVATVPVAASSIVPFDLNVPCSALRVRYVNSAGPQGNFSLEVFRGTVL
jgi:hypothetical protein